MVTQKITTAAADDRDAFIELHKLDKNHGSPFLLDAHEVDKVIELTAEVPGVLDNDIEVNLEGELLTIGVEKRAPDEGKRTHFSERSYGRFQRSIQLPFAPDGNSVTAIVEKGVLVVRIPRVESERTRRIAIGALHSKTDRERSAIGSTWGEKSGAEKPLTLTDLASTAPPRPDRPPNPKT